MGDGAARSLTASECLRLLRGTDTARVALSRGALPVVEPVHYRLDDEWVELVPDLVTSFGGGDRTVVCLEVDGVTEDGTHRWVVQVTAPLRTSGDEPQIALSTAVISGDLRPLRPPATRDALEP